MIVTLSAVVLLTLLGMAFALAAVPGRGNGRLLLCSGLAPFLGFGLCSVSLFLFGYLFDGLAFVAMSGEAIALFCMFLVAVWIITQRRSDSNASEFSLPPLPRRKHFFLLFACLFFSLARFGAEYWQSSLEHPHGWWDAIMIWNCRARFWLTTQFGFAHAFEVDSFGHADYPILLPLTVARLWVYEGVDTTQAPKIIGLYFGLAGMWCLATILLVTKGWTHAVIGLVILSGTPGWAEQSAWQLADIPLAGYFLASLCCMFCADRFSSIRRELDFLTGFMLGCAAWTKNEGIVFAVVSFVAITGFRLMRLNKRQAEFSQRSDLAWPLIAGLAIPAITLLTFKLTIAPANDILEGQTLSLCAERLTDSERWRVIASHAVGEVMSLRDGMHNDLILPILATIIAMIGFRASRINIFRLLPLMAIITATTISYLSAYLITPHELTWHLGTSIFRLAMQLWPALLLIALLTTQPVSENEGKTALSS